MHATPVKMLVLDVDGVMTDGSIILDDAGVETKRFNVRDGFGITMWQQLGFHTAIITKRGGRAVERRAEELSIKWLFQGVASKTEALATLLEETKLQTNEVAYLGDDWPDLAVMKQVAYPMAVADAEAAVRTISRYITKRPGGRGAVREAVEHLLQEKDLLREAYSLYDVSAESH